MQKWNKISFTELISDRTKDGIKLPTNEYNQSGLTAIIDQGQEFIAGYSDETEGAFTDVPAIIFGDHTRVFKYVDFPFFLGADGVKVLKANQEINYKYLYYYFLQAKFPNTGYARHFKWLKELQIPLPPLETQENIAAVLDKCTALIAKHKLMLEKYDTLIKSRFIEMFGDNPVENGKWKVEKLGNLVTVTSSKRIYAEEQSTEGIPFLRISDLVSKINGIDSNDLYIPEEKYHEFVENGLVPNVDDILVTSRGTLGLCYTITADDKFYFQDGMITWLKFSNHESILSIFLSFLFNVILKQKIDLKTNGATVKYVSISELKNLEIPVPPLELQQQFAAFVQQIDKSKFVVQKSLEKAETLYKSLMQEYFG